jgi:cytidylate kinase
MISRHGKHLASRHRVIAIDGPAGSGKSTTAKLLATRLNFTYLDTGAMYRCVTLAAKERGVDTGDEVSVGRLASQIKIDFIPTEDGNRVMMDGRDVTLEIRTPGVDAAVSSVSSYKGVRERMVTLQKQFAERGDIVAEGRDVTTVVFPGADLKIFLTADLKTRAIRRCRQLEGYGLTSTVEEQLAALSSRDLFDSGRTHSPLKQDRDAAVIDTSGMSINEQVERAYELACERLGIEQPGSQ